MKLNTFESSQDVLLGSAGGSEKREFFEALRADTIVIESSELSFNAYIRQYSIENKKVAVTATCFSLVNFLAAVGGFLISVQKTFIPLAGLLSTTTFTYGAINTLFQARVSRKNELADLKNWTDVSKKYYYSNIRRLTPVQAFKLTFALKCPCFYGLNTKQSESKRYEGGKQDITQPLLSRSQRKKARRGQ